MWNMNHRPEPIKPAHCCFKYSRTLQNLDMLDGRKLAKLHEHYRSIRGRRMSKLLLLEIQYMHM